MHRSDAWRTSLTAPTCARGFTLVELMIVVVIVSILAAIAMPSYALFMKKSRRGDAEATLMDIAQREQQYLIDARAYAGTTAALNTTVPVDVSTYYTIAIVPGAGPPPTFTVSATPIAGSPQAGDYTLTLDQNGLRGPAAAW